MTRTLPTYLTITSLLLVGSACASDPEPVAYSEAISVRLGGIKDGDVLDGQAAADKKVDEESGSPYKEFIELARFELDGLEPSAIRVTRATVQLRADTVGVNGLEEVFERVELYLDDDRTTIPIGSVDAPAGTSLDIPISATLGDLDPIQETLLGRHDVRVGVRGPTIEATPADFDLKLTVDIVFEALP